MATKNPSEENQVQLLAEETLLLENFRRRVTQMNRLLNSFDPSEIATEDEREIFWERLIVEGEDLMSLFRQIVTLHGGSAKDRILRYLQARVGEPVSGKTLETVAGISAWGRRVRELRVEYGYEIATSDTDPTLGPGQYRLEQSEPDIRRAEWWKFQNNLRRRNDMSSSEKILAILKARPGEPIDAADLSYVVKNDDWRSILTQLRLNGIPIRSAEDRDSLESSQYLLEV